MVARSAALQGQVVRSSGAMTLHFLWRAPMGHRRRNEDQQRDDDRSRSDDYKAVLLDLLPGSLFCSSCEPRQWDGCVRREWQIVIASLIFRWLLKDCSVAVVVVSVWMNHFAPPETGATNAIGTRTGRSTSSAWATASRSLSLDSLKVGRSNTTMPSALAPGASLRDVIH